MMVKMFRPQHKDLQFTVSERTGNIHIQQALIRILMGFPSNITQNLFMKD